MLSRSFLNTKDEAGRLVSASHAGGTTQTSSDVRRAEPSHNVFLPPPLSPLTSSPPPLLPCYCLPLKVFTSLIWTRLFLLLFPPFLSASGRYVGPVLTLASVLTSTFKGSGFISIVPEAHLCSMSYSNINNASVDELKWGALAGKVLQIHSVYW